MRNYLRFSRGKRNSYKINYLYKIKAVVNKRSQTQSDVWLISKIRFFLRDYPESGKYCFLKIFCYFQASLKIPFCIIYYILQINKVNVIEKIKQRLANLCCKRQNNTYFWHCRPYYITTTQFCCSIKAAIKIHKQMCGFF